MVKRLPLLLLLLLAACAGSGKPTAPQATVPPAPLHLLADTDWTLTSLEGQPLVADTSISLRFEANTFSGSAGCNRYGADYVVADDGSLSHPNLAVTVELCLGPEGVMEQEQAYVDALSRVAAYRLSGDSLELQDAAGRTLLVYGRQSPAGMDPAGLPGTAWRLVSMGGAVAPAEPAITLGFLDGGWLAGHAGCRGYVSAYQASGSDLRLPFTSMVEPDCPDGERLLLEGEYTTLLEWVIGYRLSQGQLELLTDRGRSLLYEPLPPAALQGSHWSLVAFVDERRVEGMPLPLPEMAPVLSGTEITLTFQDGQATGSAGCNTYGAEYTDDGGTVAFGPAVATEMHCQTPAGVMDQERRYLQFLDTAAYHVVGSQLWLRRPDGQALVLSHATPGTEDAR